MSYHNHVAGGNVGSNKMREKNSQQKGQEKSTAGTLEIMECILKYSLLLLVKIFIFCLISE